MFKWLFKKKGCAKHMNNKLEVIGIDHGWSMMKTISQVFVTGVTPIVFVGGGAVVMKNFGSHDAKNISYNLDVKANARGYEQLATMGLKSTKRLS